MSNFFVSCPRGLEPLLTGELQNMGATDVRETLAGVSVEGAHDLPYRAALWSRIADRVFIPLTEIGAEDPQQIYTELLPFPWPKHFDYAKTFRVDVTLRGHVSPTLKHTRFLSQKVKDAIVDSFRNAGKPRPNVRLDEPDIRFHLHIQERRATLSLDLAGPLHRRGYRRDTGPAPLRENLAAAILMRAGWPQLAQENSNLVDPLCGSGTFLVEGALMATDTAPGLIRWAEGRPTTAWKNFDSQAWSQILEEAHERRKKGRAQFSGKIQGYDRDRRVLPGASDNARRAGVDSLITLKGRAITNWSDTPPATGEGLLVANPPYGERMGELAELVSLYGSLGELFKTNFPGWKAALLTGNSNLGKQMGLKASKKYRVHNGPLPCDLLLFEIRGLSEINGAGEPSSDEATLEESNPPPAPVAIPKPIHKLSQGVEILKNRLEKNIRQIGKWAQKNHLECYRIYDRDLPEYNVSVDIYGDSAVVQEHEAPKEIPAEKTERRLQEMLRILPELLDIAPGKIYLKVRKKQKGKSQYEKVQQLGRIREIRENGHRFKINLSDYLDTGIFIDHRLVRAKAQELSEGKAFLNLFCYTGSATVYAAAGGAKRTVSVDLSKTYMDWAQENMALNGFTGPEHSFVQADCLEWIQRDVTEKFDLIFLDPPTFSNSKRMDADFDVQTDHFDLIELCGRFLQPHGKIIFSAHSKNFEFEKDRIQEIGFQCEDLSRKTLPEDFSRREKSHHCWLLTLTSQ